jgi:uncharacterized protein YjbI with pentapeptide repeats
LADVYGGNVLLNGSAESGTTSFTTTGTPTAEAGGVVGSNCFKLDPGEKLTQTVSATVGYEDYKLTGYFHLDPWPTSADVDVFVKITVTIGTDVFSEIVPLSSKAYREAAGLVSGVVREWAEFEAIINTQVPAFPGSATYKLEFTNASTATTLRLDDLRFRPNTGQEIPDRSITEEKIALQTITTALIQDAAITNALIIDAAITTAKIDDLAVSTAKIADAAILTAKIADAAITNAKIDRASVDKLQVVTADIVNASITSAKIANGAIDSAKIGDLQVTTAKIQLGAITTALIGDAQITNAKIDRASANKLVVVSADIQDAAITSAKIADATIVNADIANATITGAKIANATIGAAQITLASITTALIGDAQITNAKIDRASANKLVIVTADIQDAAINAAKIQDASITNAEIANATITGAKIANATIGTANIVTGAITTALIGDGQITTAKIGNAQITDALINDLTAGKITAGTLNTALVTVQGTNGKLRISGNRMQVFDNQGTPVERVSIGDVNADGTIYGLRVRGADGVTVLYDQGGVYNEGITNGAVTNPKIGDDAVDGRIIAADVVTAEHILGKTITAAEIASQTITAAEMVAGTITAASGIIADAAIVTAKIADAAITSTKIQDATIVNGDIANATIQGAKIANATIADANIVAATITGAKIANATITSALIQDAAIITAKIQDAAITTAKITDLAVTSAKVSRLSADKVTVGSGSVFDAGYNPTSKRDMAKTSGTEVFDQRYIGDSTKLPNIASGTYTIAPPSELTLTDNINMIKTVGQQFLKSELIPYVPHTPVYFYVEAYNQTNTTGTLYVGLEFYDKNGVSLGANDLTIYAVSDGTLPIDTWKTLEGWVDVPLTDTARNAAAFVKIRVLTRWGLTPSDTTGVTYLKKLSVKQLNRQSAFLLWNYPNTTSIDGGNLYTNTVTANSMVAGTITAASGIIANAAIGTAQLIDAAITTAKIADAQITGAKIVDATITAAEIADATITGAKIASATIDTGNIKDAAITTAKIGTAQITDALISSLDAAKITSVGGATHSTNIAAGKAIVSNLASEATKPHSRINDGVKVKGTDNYASLSNSPGTPGTGAEGNYIGYDLTAVFKLAQSVIYFYSMDTRFYYYKIKYSTDNVNWYYAVGDASTWMKSMPAGESGTTLNPTVNTFSIPVRARYIRLYMDGNSVNTGNHIDEWELYSREQTSIDGGRIVTNTITADHISVTTLSAITGNLGTINAGTINGVSINSSTFTASGSLSTTTITGDRVKNVSAYDSNQYATLEDGQIKVNSFGGQMNIFGDSIGTTGDMYLSATDRFIIDGPLADRRTSAYFSVMPMGEGNSVGRWINVGIINNTTDLGSNEYGSFMATIYCQGNYGNLSNQDVSPIHFHWGPRGGTIKPSIQYAGENTLTGGNNPRIIISKSGTDYYLWFWQPPYSKFCTFVYFMPGGVAYFTEQAIFGTWMWDSASLGAAGADVQPTRFGHDVHVNSDAGTARWSATNSHYILQRRSDGAVWYYMGAVVKHSFHADGTKSGGSIEVDGKTLGMSPIDSPQVNQEYVEYGIPLTPEGVKVYVDPTYLKTVAHFDVWPNRGELVEVGLDYFIIRGTGKASCRIIGERVGYAGVFYDNMDIKAEEVLSDGEPLVHP